MVDPKLTICLALLGLLSLNALQATPMAPPDAADLSGNLSVHLECKIITCVRLHFLLSDCDNNFNKRIPTLSDFVPWRAAKTYFPVSNYVASWTKCDPDILTSLRRNWRQEAQKGHLFCSVGTTQRVLIIYFSIATGLIDTCRILQKLGAGKRAQRGRKAARVEVPIQAHRPHCHDREGREPHRKRVLLPRDRGPHRRRVAAHARTSSLSWQASDEKIFCGAPIVLSLTLVLSMSDKLFVTVLHDNIYLAKLASMLHINNAILNTTQNAQINRPLNKSARSFCHFDIILLFFVH